MRKVLNAVVKEQVLDEEGLTTLMCEVEAIVNGRPISKVSDDPKDMEALTPSHLLLLRGGPTLPPDSFRKEDMQLLLTKMAISAVPCRRVLETMGE